MLSRISSIARKIGSVFIPGSRTAQKTTSFPVIPKDTVSISPAARAADIVQTEKITLENLTTFMLEGADQLETQAAFYHLEKLFKHGLVELQVDKGARFRADFLAAIFDGVNRNLKVGDLGSIEISLSEENNSVKQHDPSLYVRVKIGEKTPPQVFCAASIFIEKTYEAINHLFSDFSQKKKKNSLARFEIIKPHSLKEIYYKIKSYILNPYNIFYEIYGRLWQLSVRREDFVLALRAWLRNSFISSKYSILEDKIGKISESPLICFGESHVDTKASDVFKELLMNIPGLTHIGLEIHKDVQPALDIYLENQTEGNFKKLKRELIRMLVFPHEMVSGDSFFDRLSGINDPEIIKIAAEKGIKIICLDIPRIEYCPSSNANVQLAFDNSGYRDKNSFVPLINGVLQKPGNKMLIYCGFNHNVYLKQYGIPQNFIKYIQHPTFSIFKVGPDPVISMLAEQKGVTQEQFFFPLEGADRLYDAVIVDR